MPVVTDPNHFQVRRRVPSNSLGIGDDGGTRRTMFREKVTPGMVTDVFCFSLKTDYGII